MAAQIIATQAAQICNQISKIQNLQRDQKISLQKGEVTRGCNSKSLGLQLELRGAKASRDLAALYYTIIYAHELWAYGICHAYRVISAWSYMMCRVDIVR